MARCLTPMVLLAVLLTPALAPAAPSPGQASTRSEATDNVRQGLAHFERAFYQLMPGNRSGEAEAEFDLAEAAFLREVSLRPASVAAHRALARLNAVRGRDVQAAREYDEVARLEPSDADALVLAALSYAKLGHFDTARNRLLDARGRTDDAAALARLDEYLARLDAAAKPR